MAPGHKEKEVAGTAPQLPDETVEGPRAEEPHGPYPPETARNGFCPEPPEGTRPCGRFTESPVRLLRDLWPPNLRDDKPRCFEPLSLREFVPAATEN